MAPSIEWRLTTEKINDLQIDSIKRLIPLCKAAHFVNVRVRINGTWEEYQADWIKHMVRIERAADPTSVSQDDYDALAARLAEAVECCTIKDNRNLWLEIRLQKVMARCADLLDEDQFNELDAMTRAADPQSPTP